MKQYRLVASTDSFNNTIPGKRICRFCKRNETQVTFKTKSHAIPELLGENNYIGSNECDECNNNFSRYETHLSIFFRPYLTMIGVKGKTKIPEFHSRTENGDETTRTVVKVEENGTRKIILSDLADYKIDKTQKIISITFRKPPHKPFWVYKALVKIGLSLLPEEHINKFTDVFNWLQDESYSVDSFITVFITVLTGSKFAKPFSELYLANRTIYKNHFIPKATLIVAFGNIVVQIFLPESCSEKKGNKQPHMNLYQAFAFDKNSLNQELIINAIDLKSKSSVTSNETLHFSFEEAKFDTEE